MSTMSTLALQSSLSTPAGRNVSMGSMPIAISSTPKRPMPVQLAVCSADSGTVHAKTPAHQKPMVRAKSKDSAIAPTVFTSKRSKKACNQSSTVDKAAPGKQALARFRSSVLTQATDTPFPPSMVLKRDAEVAKHSSKSPRRTLYSGCKQSSNLTAVVHATTAQARILPGSVHCKLATPQSKSCPTFNGHAWTPSSCIATEFIHEMKLIAMRRISGLMRAHRTFNRRCTAVSSSSQAMSRSSETRRRSRASSK
mmetsp:Transcript_8289/g.20935  ORF Transcript_8289/g.20935 Transcript_8289/m.20935 type:complete len:253 (-) Transcript_8289:449-1207(-)